MMDQGKLTQIEEHAMRVLWDRGAVSASELVMALPETTRPDHAGALKLLRNLDAKGAVSRHQSGRSVVYKPRLNPETARSHVLGRLFETLPSEDSNGLNLVVLRESDLDPQDWADLQAERAEKARRRNR